MQVNAHGVRSNRLSVAQLMEKVRQRFDEITFDVCPQPDEECADGCVRDTSDQADDECSSGEATAQIGDDACNVLVVSQWRCCP